MDIENHRDKFYVETQSQRTSRKSLIVLLCSGSSTLPSSSRTTKSKPSFLEEHSESNKLHSVITTTTTTTVNNSLDKCGMISPTTEILVSEHANRLVTRSSAVTVIADRTAYHVWYSYRPVVGIALVSISIYLFI